MKKYRVVSANGDTLKKTDSLDTAIAYIRNLSEDFLRNNHWVLERLTGDAYEYYEGWHEESDCYLHPHNLNI